MSRDQAALVFGLAAKMARLNPSLDEHLHILDSFKQIRCPAIGTLYSALSADAGTNFGKSPVFIVHDELGQVRGPRHDMYDALETAVGAHEEPLSIIISTQAPNDGDLLSILIDDALSNRDPQTVISLYTAPMEADPFEDATIALANPAYGDFLNASVVKKMAEDARAMPAREAEYRNYVLNQRVEAINPFVTKTVWLANGADPKEPKGAFGGLDLSEVNDLTALILVSPRRSRFDVTSRFWLPEEGLAERSRQDRVPYDVWARDGFIERTPGQSIEYEFVAGQIAELFRDHDIRKIAFDRQYMRQFRPWLVKAGLSDSFIDSRFVPFGQGYLSMGPALRTLESLLLNRKLRHGNNPVLTMCAQNARATKDPAGNRKFDKSRAGGRIDGMVALAMATSIAGEVLHERHVYDVPIAQITE
ncbi:phage terminase large subunit [Methyloceanibacter caenitepidi]|uniref:Phage terminase large subunit n=2 Tax=Methyloceanibacter caenitepidi TaxID=1384459 RepID=A0A0A8K1U9_9HYPH|nr:phage terminase large subunit [Methyloceanibacter caenitepidi]